MPQKTRIKTETAGRVLIVTLEANKLRAAGPGAIFQEPAPALLLSVGMPQYAVDFRRQ